MAVRDDAGHNGGYGDFGLTRARDILEAWESLNKPYPMEHWLEVLTHEPLRLQTALDLTPENYERWGDLGHRSEQHLR